MESDYLKVCKVVDDVCQKHGLGRPNKTKTDLTPEQMKMIKNSYGYATRDFIIKWIEFKITFLESLRLPQKPKKNKLDYFRKQKEKAEQELQNYVDSFDRLSE